MKNETKVQCKIKVAQNGEFGNKDNGLITKVDGGHVDVIVFAEGEDGKVIRNIRHRDFMKEGKPYWQHLDDNR